MALTIELLGSFGTYMTLFELNHKAITSILEALVRLLKISSLYKKRKLGLMVIKKLKQIRKKWLSEYKGNKKLKAIIKIIDKSIKEINKIWEESEEFKITLDIEL